MQFQNMQIFLSLGSHTTLPLLMVGKFKDSSHRALKNGIKLKDVFQIVKKFKKIKF